jgi:hypothetical protein
MIKEIDRIFLIEDVVQDLNIFFTSQNLIKSNYFFAPVQQGFTNFRTAGR